MSLLSEHFAKARESTLPHIYVVGNEAADLDSIGSAIAVAYLLRERYLGYVLIPVVQNRIEVVRLRGEVLLALSFVGLAAEDLLYVDQLPVSCDVILVDHNNASRCTSGRVLSIFDHHVDDGLFLHPETSPRLIRTCASTASVLINELRDVKDADFDALRPLLDAIITFDTVNWTWRVTDYDMQAAARLYDQKLSVADLHAQGAGLMQQMEESFIDECTIDPFLLLFKDLKFSPAPLRYAVSILHVPFAKLTGGDYEGFVRSVINRFVKQHDQLIHFFVFSSVREPGQYSFYQQFFAWSRSGGVPSLLSRMPEMGLTVIHETDSFGFYDMANLDISRKRFVPLINQTLSCYCSYPPFRNTPLRMAFGVEVIGKGLLLYRWIEPSKPRYSEILGDRRQGVKVRWDAAGTLERPCSSGTDIAG